MCGGIWGPAREELHSNAEGGFLVGQACVYMQDHCYCAVPGVIMTGLAACAHTTGPVCTKHLGR